MTYVFNSRGVRVPFGASVPLMDDDIRETVAADLAPCDDQTFFAAYAKRHAERYGVEWEPDSARPCI